MALYGTRLIFHSAARGRCNRQDGYLMALDARDRRDRLGRDACPTLYASNSGPIVANGLILQGMGTCQIYEENKCFISAYDPATGDSAGDSERSRVAVSQAATHGADCPISTAPVARHGSPGAMTRI